MKTIVNKTREPLKIHLPGSKILHFGPNKSGQISDQAAADESIRKLVLAGKIEIVGETAHGPEAKDGGSAAHEATHGHAPTTVVLPKGNR